MVRIGGVPEHFNMPWHWAIDQGMFYNADIQIEWKDFPGGTGEMNQALKNNEIDMAVLLTEGAVAEISKGNPYKILQWYVKSPLVWGVHVHANSGIDNVLQIKNQHYAISRIGSGSHLMAHVEADIRNEEISNAQFVLVGNLAGAAKALTDNTAQVFLWEKFMTKSLVDQNIFRRIGECATPWSSFVLVAKSDFVENNLVEVNKIKKLIVKAAADFKILPDAMQLIADRYNLQPNDVTEWLASVEWAIADNSQITTNELDKVCARLQKLGLMEVIANTEFIF